MENIFLKYLFKSNMIERIGDDGAIIHKWVYAMDSFVEGSHFKKDWLSIDALVLKSLSVNASDIYAMGAFPKYALLSITLPKTLDAMTLKKIAQAIHQACHHYQIKLIGGDTITSSLMGFHWTLIGMRSQSQWVFRKKIRRGDLLCFSGNLGNSYQSLKQLLRHTPITPCKRHQKFYANQVGSRLIPYISHFIHAGMDISDGLSTELYRLSKLNQIGFKFLKPLSKQTLISGEEYEALISVAPKYLLKLKRIAKRHRIPITVFAQAKRGYYRNKGKKWH